MRDIKFRVWDIENQCFSKKHSKLFLPCWVSPISGEGEGNIEFRNHRTKVIIQQYTGFTDRNGKDVYEGDILGLYLPSSSTGYRQNPIKEVIFLDGAFCLKDYNKEFDYDRDFGMPGNMRASGNPWVIVSNIFEYKKDE